MRNFSLIFILMFLICLSAKAQIGSVAGNSWSPIGNTEITRITSDGDNGDGVGDGAQKLVNLSSGVGFGMLYNFNGTMLQDESLTFETYAFNPQSSYVRIKVELYNVSDNVVLADSGTVVMTSGVTQGVVLNYTALASDDGDQLQIRYIRVDDGNSSRTFAIDNAHLNGAYLYPEAGPAPSCFDNTGGQEEGWIPIEGATITAVNDDADNGDGIGDGALKIEGAYSGTPIGAGYTFSCFMPEDQALEVSSAIYNVNNSYVGVKLELFNLTDNVVLAGIGHTVNANSMVTFDLNYFTQASDLGDQLQLRLLRNDDGNAVRIFNIDYVTINNGLLNMQNAPPAPSCFDNTGNEEGWDRIGDVTINEVTDDGDNGDGGNDGGLAVVSLSSGTGVESGAFYTFDCSMAANQILQIESVLFNIRNSYVGAEMQLYNSTDDVVLATTGKIVVGANSAKPMALSYITKGPDEGDQLQLRYLRNDDGNPVRSFSIDWATINGATLNMKIVTPPLNPACANGVNVEPDIPLEPVTPEEAAEVEKVYNTLSNTYLGTVPNAQFKVQMDQALLDYDSLNITVNGYQVNGKKTSFLAAGSIVSAFAKYLKYVDSNDTEVAQKASNVVALVSQQFCRGDILLEANAYDFENFSRPTLFLRDYLTDSIKDQFGYVLDAQTRSFQSFWGDHQEGEEYNTDWMYNMGAQMVLYGTFRYPDNDEEKVRYMKAGKRYLERFLTYSNGTGDGLKPDGTGFHHWTAYDGYMYTLTSVINIVEAFDDTEFQIDKAYYYVLRNAIYAQKMFSNDTQTRALSMAGRKPFLRKVGTGQAQVRKLAISGGKILGLPTADPLLAGYYNRAWGNEPAFNYNTSTPFEEGYIQLNYAHAGVYRKDNWVAVMNGFSNNMPGSELFATNNRYGRYQSYGALEILYPGGTALGENGFDAETWNWNYNPGTTTIVLPWEKLQGERERIDELQQKRFVGSLAFNNKGEAIGVLKKNYGTYGVFAMDFQEKENQGFGAVYGPNTHNSTFTFKKSNFAFDDIIVCLGSGITNNDTDNSTVTTLYQRLAGAQSGVTVNSSFYGTGENNFTDNQDNWIIDDYHTGFFVAKGSGGLKVWKGNQQTPNENEVDPNSYHDNAVGTYTLGYIDHGKKPVDAGYEYVIKPNATTADMQAIQAKRPYQVLEKSSERHVVKHNEDDIWGYALFEPSTDLDYVGGVIKANNAPCLIMCQKIDNKHILLSMTDPDLGFEARSNQSALTKNILLTLHGEWSLYRPNSQVNKVSETDSTSTFLFQVKKAMPVEVDFIKTKKVKKIHITPAATRYIKVGETYSFRGFVTPANATDVNLVWSCNDETVATVDQEGTTTGISVGNATIILTDQNSGLSDSLDVVVNSTIPHGSDTTDQGKSGLILYPNPTFSSLTVQMQEYITSYAIYDYSGEIRLSKSNLKAKEIVIQVDALYLGIYILQVTDKKGETRSEQFIKE